MIFTNCPLWHKERLNMDPVPNLHAGPRSQPAKQQASKAAGLFICVIDIYV